MNFVLPRRHPGSITAVHSRCLRDFKHQGIFHFLPEKGNIDHFDHLVDIMKLESADIILADILYILEVFF